MTRFAMTVAVLVAALATSPAVLAHEGHAHKVMGTVATLHENHLEVKATDGKTTAVMLDDNTKIFRGKTKATLQDIKPGERVVVTAMEKKGADGKPMMLASEIRLAETASSPTGQ
jgi:hypothetical protein